MTNRLNEDIKHMMNCGNRKKRAMEEEFDEVRRYCEIFTQQVQTVQAMETQILEGHDEQIQILEFILKMPGWGLITCKNNPSRLLQQQKTNSQHSEAESSGLNENTRC
jgi:hypothetical protein